MPDEDSSRLQKRPKESSREKTDESERAKRTWERDHDQNTLNYSLSQACSAFSDTTIQDQFLQDLYVMAYL